MVLVRVSLDPYVDPLYICTVWVHILQTFGLFQQAVVINSFL